MDVMDKVFFLGLGTWVVNYLLLRMEVENRTGSRLTAYIGTGVGVLMMVASVVPDLMTTVHPTDAHPPTEQSSNENS